MKSRIQVNDIGCYGGCPPVFGQVQGPIRSFNGTTDLGVILWVFADINGQISLEGSIGTSASAQIGATIKKPKNGAVQFEGALQGGSPSEPALLMPTVHGKIDSNVKLGVSIDFDVFILNP